MFGMGRVLLFWCLVAVGLGVSLKDFGAVENVNSFE